MAPKKQPETTSTGISRLTLTPVEMSTMYAFKIEELAKQGVFVALTLEEYRELKGNENSRLKDRLERAEASHKADAEEKRRIIDRLEREAMRLNRAAHALVDAIGGSTGRDLLSQLSR